MNARDNGGGTPLHRAAEEGKIAVVASLIASGADLKAKNNDGKTPMEMAKNQLTRKLIQNAEEIKK